MNRMILWDMDATLVTEDPLHPLDPKKTIRKFYPGMIDLFHQFHSQYRMMILSTDLQKDEVVFFLQVNQIHQCIHEIYCSDDHLLQEEEGNSTSNIFEFILKRSQIQKSDCVYIRSCDHSAHHQMAKEMGIYSIATAFGRGHEDLQDPTSEVVYSMDELVQALRSFSSKTQSRRRKSRSKSVSWQEDVIDNEGMGKLRTDDEYWDPSDRS